MPDMRVNRWNGGIKCFHPMSETTHSYYDWQVSTLLLAYDAVEPLGRDDEAAAMSSVGTRKNARIAFLTMQRCDVITGRRSR